MFPRLALNQLYSSAIPRTHDPPASASPSRALLVGPVRLAGWGGVETLHPGHFSWGEKDRREAEERPPFLLLLYLHTGYVWAVMFSQDGQAI